MLTYSFQLTSRESTYVYLLDLGQTERGCHDERRRVSCRIGRLLPRSRKPAPCLSIRAPQRQVARPCPLGIGCPSRGQAATGPGLAFLARLSISVLEDHEIDLIVGGNLRDAIFVADAQLLTMLALPIGGVGLALANGAGTLAYMAS